jgi:hypothetical protein
MDHVPSDALVFSSHRREAGTVRQILLGKSSRSKRAP